MPPRNQPPKYLPSDVRDRPDVMRACATHDIGSLFRLINNVTDTPTHFTKSHIARRCDLTPTRVDNYMKNLHETVTLPVILRVADGLQIPGARFGLAPRPWEGEGTSPKSVTMNVPARKPVLVGAASSPDNQPEPHLAAMETFRIQDRRIGGGHFYRSVADYLGQQIGPQLAGGSAIGGDLRIFSAAAGLNEMAGWMAHDAGRDNLAGLHFRRALALSQMAGKPEHSAGIYGSMSHLALQSGDSKAAVELARSGRQTARLGVPQASLEARLFVMEARGLAARGERRATSSALGRADAVLSGSSGDELSEWLSPFDEASFAIEAAHCMRATGQSSAALRTAEHAVALRDAERARSRAFGQILVAQLLVEQGDVDGACDVGRAVISNTIAPGSARVIALLEELHLALVPYQSSRVVFEFLTLLSQEQQSRRWLMSGLDVPDDEGRARNHADPSGHDAG